MAALLLQQGDHGSPPLGRKRAEHLDEMPLLCRKHQGIARLRRQFISEDPVERDIERLVTQNRFVAFNADSTVYTDLDGRCGLAASDASECINNVAVAYCWSAERTLEEQ